MKKIFITLTTLSALTFNASAAHNTSLATDSILRNYTDSLNALVARQASQATLGQKTPSPYLFHLLGPGTLYHSALTQQMAQTTPPAAANSNLPSLGSTDDEQLLLHEASNQELSLAYIRIPQLFTTTQTALAETGGIRSDLEQTVVEDVKLAEKVVEDVPDVIVEAAEPEVKRPNFWTFKGNGSIQFNQNYYSKNWYQGGENTYSMINQLSFDANFNNQRKVQWDNKFEAQLGFQTSQSSVPKFRPNSNLLRLTSNLGIKAIGNWNYSAQLQLQSQPYRGYQGSTRNVISDFLSPLYVRSSIGMDYNIKKKRFTGKLHLAPLSYVITYVHVDSRVTRYGIVKGHNSKHEWGPNIDFTFDYKITKDISWHSRLYWFSNFALTRIENEHTFNFSINKYLSAKLYLYPRYEDTKFYNFKQNEDGSRAEDSARRTHWMFKEWLSLGLNYDF